MTVEEWRVIPEDRRVLRELAARVAEIAHSEGNAERRRRWLSHNSLRGGGPMVLAEIGGLLQSGEWSNEHELVCQEGWARHVESGLRWTLVHQDQVKDDKPVEAVLNCPWRVSVSDYGVAPVRTSGSRDGQMGSCTWEPPLKNLRSDLEKLRPRTYSVDREASLAWRDHVADLFDGLLQARLRGGFWWTVGLTWAAIDLVGLDHLMMYLCDDPEGVHRLLGFLRDDQMAYARWLEAEGLLTLNNENDYIGSGSLGYTCELPGAGAAKETPPRLKDLWVLSESQETVGISPRMFGEFIFPHQKPLIESFGLSYYGCCEPVHGRWPYLSTLSNLRKVSVSPWCDEAKMAEAVGSRVIYCRKPNPALISTERFDEDAIRQDLRYTLEVARGCHVELVMKDVHTLSHEPWRLGRWVELAREACAEAE
ncbi:MAG TPA: hypothetical protein VGN26_03030 [Armatimonadota bacterium]